MFDIDSDRQCNSKCRYAIWNSRQQPPSCRPAGVQQILPTTSSSNFTGPDVQPAARMLDGCPENSANRGFAALPLDVALAQPNTAAALLSRIRWNSLDPLWTAGCLLN